ncbi:boule homolog, RNA binding protein isoform X4 [Haematobia irritans]|uniref:boule homolog, RNA binding protein isoform X4 n=1 Tax=Haematobia irritans TaxID=7368 RepID=UPI003F4FDF29
MHKMAAPAGAAPTGLEAPLSAPKYGTLIPNRIFVGGISGDTTESDLCRVFSAYGNVKSTKIIVDRAGVSKGYGFVTFETEQEAQRLQTDTTHPSPFYCNFKRSLRKNKAHNHTLVKDNGFLFSTISLYGLWLLYP